ncbi:hypothetical protein AeRB84_016511 [Aphanomyces euteiches]|nr:hypothetical protein AeRB84_016511 [Aphanomyces euteiches]
MVNTFLVAIDTSKYTLCPQERLQENNDVSSTTALAQDKTDQPPLETNKTARRPVAGGVARKYISHAWRHHHVALETTRACRHAMEIPLQAMDIEHEDDQAEGVNDRLDLDASRATRLAVLLMRLGRVDR